MYTGHDPRDNPKTYLHWYCNKFDDISEVREDINDELFVVLGYNYDEQRLQPLIKQLGDSLGSEEFIGQLPLMENLANELSKYYLAYSIRFHFSF